MKMKFVDLIEILLVCSMFVALRFSNWIFTIVELVLAFIFFTIKAIEKKNEEEK